MREERRRLAGRRDAACSAAETAAFHGVAERRRPRRLSGERPAPGRRDAACSAAETAAFPGVTERRRLAGWLGGVWRRPLAATAALLLLALTAFADSEQDRRNEAGIRLFGTLLAADVDLAKKATPDGKLLLLIYYANDARAAESLARSLRVTPSGEPRKLGGLAVDVAVTNDATFAGRNPAGIFLAQPPPAPTLKSIIQYGISKRIIVYSPFEGHVESGVAGGLSIGAQVKPYINAATLQASQISLKAIFMKVAKVYQ